MEGCCVDRLNSPGNSGHCELEPDTLRRDFAATQRAAIVTYKCPIRCSITLSAIESTLGGTSRLAMLRWAP